MLGDANFRFSVKYKVGSSHGIVVDGDRLRDVPDPVPCRDETIPDPDSVPLSILNHPIGKRHELNFAAYDPPELAPCPGEGTHPVSVFCITFPFKDLTIEQVWRILRVYISKRTNVEPYDEVCLRQG